QTPRDAYKDESNSTPTFDPVRSVLHAFRESMVSDLLKAVVKSCSDALFVYDASTGGRPSYRVEESNKIEGAAQALLAGPVGGDGNTAKM
ncbi:hypothetical protein C0992_001656, partial [Termitomyces sp. T32_za158]